jgi:hypothetical protein
MHAPRMSTDDAIQSELVTALRAWHEAGALSDTSRCELTLLLGIGKATSAAVD